MDDRHEQRQGDVGVCDAAPGSTPHLHQRRSGYGARHALLQQGRERVRCSAQQRSGGDGLGLLLPLLLWLLLLRRWRP